MPTAATEAIYKRLGVAVLARRKRRGLSQGQLGNIVGLTRSSVANIEAGRQRVLLHDVYAFCGAFDVTPQTLLKEVW
jgi:transcriptional regulator with XRE-family HTH domain